MPKMAMPRHMHIKNSHILKSCSPTNNLLPLFGFFSRASKGYLSRSSLKTYEEQQLRAIIISLCPSRRDKHIQKCLRINAFYFFFPFLQNILHQWHLQNQPPCDSNILTKNAGVLTHFFTTEIWFLQSLISTSHTKKSSLLMTKKN